jgi:hypothetical protein
MELFVVFMKADETTIAAIIIADSICSKDIYLVFLRVFR